MLPAQALVFSQREAPRYALLVRAATTPDAFRVWTGVGDFEATADDDIEPSALYAGAGLLTSLPSFRQLIGGTAERIDITFAGTDSFVASLIGDNASGIRGSQINVGIVFFDDAWQTVAPVAWFYCGSGDTLTSGRTREGQRTVTLSVGAGFLNRMRAQFTYWTDANHRTRHPTDGFFKLLKRYSAGITPKWG